MQQLRRHASCQTAALLFFRGSEDIQLCKWNSSYLSFLCKSSAAGTVHTHCTDVICKLNWWANQYEWCKLGRLGIVLQQETLFLSSMVCKMYQFSYPFWIQKSYLVTPTSARDGFRLVLVRAVMVTAISEGKQSKVVNLLVGPSNCCETSGGFFQYSYIYRLSSDVGRR